MIDLSPAPSPPIPPAAPSAMAAGRAGDAPSSFGKTLGAFLDASVAATSGAAPPAERQSLAGDGKDLPATDVRDGADDDEQAQADGNDARAWFPAAVLPPLPMPTPPPPISATPDGVAVADAATTASATQSPPSATPLPPTIDGATDYTNRQPAPQPIVASKPALVPTANRPALHLPIQGTGNSSQITQPNASGYTASRANDVGPAIVVPRIDAPTTPVMPRPTTNTSLSTVDQRAPSHDAAPVAPARADMVGQAIVVSTVAQPAGQVFAAAIMTATSWRARTLRADEREPSDLSASLYTTGPLLPGDRTIVQATGDAQGSALDLTRDTGLQHMIDRIETLRDDASDGADSRDTRVRLTPDALGSVDIAVRQAGDRMHVRFTVEQDATRALIAEAQPRLTELAAARGLRIGETSVGGGAGGGGTPQQQPQASPRFTGAAVPTATDADIATDSRIA